MSYLIRNFCFLNLLFSGIPPLLRYFMSLNLFFCLCHSLFDTFVFFKFVLKYRFVRGCQRWETSVHYMASQGCSVSDNDHAFGDFSKTIQGPFRTVGRLQQVQILFTGRHYPGCSAVCTRGGVSLGRCDLHLSLGHPIQRGECLTQVEIRWQPFSPYGQQNLCGRGKVVTILCVLL